MARKLAKRVTFGLAALVVAAFVGCGDDIPAECVDLCARAAGSGLASGVCVDNFFSSRYDTNTDACARLNSRWAAGQATASDCQACSASIGASGAHCAEAQQTCY